MEVFVFEHFRSRTTGRMVRSWMRMQKLIPCSDRTRPSPRRFVLRSRSSLIILRIRPRVSSLFLLAGQRDLPLANQRVHQSHACMGVESGQGQRGGGVREEEGGLAKNLSNGSSKETQSQHLLCSQLVCWLESYDFLFQATYDPSHGYSPQPIDVTHMALSRDLQVRLSGL